MNASVEPNPRTTQDAANELLELEERIDAMRGVQAGLLEEVRQAENRLEGSAGLNALTELPNRATLLDRLHLAIAHAKRRGTRVALLFLDLNRFKQVNDTLGHGVGDEVLRLSARCLVASVRAQDTVSRYGGDEFLILLPEITHAADAAVVATKMMAVLGRPHRLSDHVLRLGAGIGISLYPDDGEDAPTLIHRAEQAMYRAKQRGSGGQAFYAGQASVEDRPSTPLKSLQQPLILYDAARAEHELRFAQLRDANEQLLLAALDAQTLQAAAEETNRRQSESMTMVVHELRNPIAPIQLAAMMLGRIPSDEPSLPRAQGIISRQIKQLTHLVDDLLDVSRASSGKLAIQLREIDVVDVIDDAIEASRPAMDTRLQSLEVSVPSRALRLNADPVRLTQVLSNLLNNASKYTPEGGLIGLSVVVADESLDLIVRDNGIGISTETLPRIFELFVQDTSATDFSTVGLGVGLTVVHQIVKAHGGRVVASSAGRNLGSRFVVTLPRLREASPRVDDESDDVAHDAT